MPTITHVETAVYTLPLREPLRWGAGHTMPTLAHCLVRVLLDDGTAGLAEANPRPTIYGETATSVAAIVRDHIAPALVGGSLASPADIAALTSRYRLLKNNNSARAAVDMALWDALAASTGTPLPDLLGATGERVRVSYILGTGSHEALAEQVAGAYAAGVRVFKVKVRGDVDSEAALLRSLRGAYPQIDCYADANETLTPEGAAAALAAYRGAGALYCEEPLPVYLMRERAALRAGSHLPLIADDSCFTPHDLERELGLNTFDVLNIKPARTGFSASLAMLRRAAGAGKAVMLGSQASSIFGCLHTLMLALVPGVSEPSEGTYWLQVDSPDALPIVDGAVSRQAVAAAYPGVRARLLARYFDS